MRQPKYFLAALELVKKVLDDAEGAGAGIRNTYLGYRSMQFCECYRRWLKRRGLSMRQIQSGRREALRRLRREEAVDLDAATGEVLEVELFVAALGASNYTYAEATRSTHGVHVLAAVVALSVLAAAGRAGRISPARLEAASLYWYFVCAVWAVLFPLVHF